MYYYVLKGPGEIQPAVDMSSNRFSNCQDKSLQIINESSCQTTDLYNSMNDARDSYDVRIILIIILFIKILLQFNLIMLCNIV